MTVIAQDELAWIRRHDELVTELHELSRALGVRNVILQRLSEHLTDEEKEQLAGL